MNDVHGRPPVKSENAPPPVVRRGLPLFLRIFAVTLGAVLCAQALNLVSVFLVRLPEPRIHELSEIADALASGRSQSPQLKVSVGEPPAETDQDVRDLEVRAGLAARLGVDQQQVRVVISRPPQFYYQKQLEGLKPGRTAKPFEAKAGDESRRSDLVIGGFTAA